MHIVKKPTTLTHYELLNELKEKSQSPERVALIPVRLPNFDVDLFGLFVVPSIYSCLVLHEVHRFVAWPQSQSLSFVGLGDFLKKKEV